MRIVEQSHEILSISTADQLLKDLERAGRTCYKSEDRITDDSAAQFVRMLIGRGHHAMIEFGAIMVKFITNRGVTHELVRHRLCSFAQESTRYVNYGGDDIAFIKPVWATELLQGTYETDVAGIIDAAEAVFLAACQRAEWDYKDLLLKGWRPEMAREVLPNALKTEIVVFANVREWRHIFRLRTSPAAHPQMRALMQPLLEELMQRVPVVFDDFCACKGTGLIPAPDGEAICKIHTRKEVAE